MLTLRTPTDKEFDQIQNHILEFELDNRDLQREQFTAAFRNDELVGFGRLREHHDCTELCSLGVVATYRRQGIGKAIAAALVERASSELYLVCIIPIFFSPLGFYIVEDYPASIREKLLYCKKELTVPEKYVVMHLQK